MLRPHQLQLKQAIDGINSGIYIKDILLMWVPGSGKSLCPVIASDLVHDKNTKIIWVCPRLSLVGQGESDFQNPYYPVDKKIRAAQNNGDPFRDLDGCTVTYQSIGASPDKWIDISKKYNIILILDEFHFLNDQGQWIKPIAEMYKNSIIRILMTGTMSRGDNLKIPFVPYRGDCIDFTDTNTRKWIIYDKEQAIKDKSILDFEVTYIKGSGEYIDKKGNNITFSQFNKSGDELRTAFYTEYAFKMIDYAVNDWILYKRKNPWSKMLIVSPNIEQAKKYKDHVLLRGLKADIATSDENDICKNNINRFKMPNEKYESIEILITVAVAYIGLNVPECSHLALLTLIRTQEWIDQVIGRIIRNYPGKEKGYLFAPADRRLKECISGLTRGLIKSADGEPVAKEEKKESENSGQQPSIIPLSSSADIDHVPHVDNKVFSFTPSSEEKFLKTEIQRIKTLILSDKKTGAKQVATRLMNARIKMVCDKKTIDMSIDELTKVWQFLRNQYQNHIRV